VESQETQHNGKFYNVSKNGMIIRKTRNIKQHMKLDGEEHLEHKINTGSAGP